MVGVSVIVLGRCHKDETQKQKQPFRKVHEASHPGDSEGDEQWEREGRRQCSGRGGVIIYPFFRSIPSPPVESDYVTIPRER